MRASAEQAVMSSAIAQGRVWHQRLQPFTHRFDYPLWMVWCDLEKIDELLGRHWAWGRAWRPVTFRDRDYLDGRCIPLAEKVRGKAVTLGLDWSRGRTFMLGQWRTFGSLFNPLVLYLHFPEGQSQPDSMIAEVQNTPWRERHFYPLTFSRGDNDALVVDHPKAFHVSPFLPMLLQYHWDLHVALPDLRIGLEDRDNQVPVFKAGGGFSHRLRRPVHQARGLFDRTHPRQAPHSTFGRVMEQDETVGRPVCARVSNCRRSS